MPLYKFKTCENCNFQEITISLNYSNYTPEIDCPCGKGKAKRIFLSFSNANGMTAKQKELGVKSSRVDAGNYMKEQRDIRKKEYPPESREANTNELWTGKEGLDGITRIPDL